MNRDYYTRPNQATGRSSYDYGNTHLGTERRMPPGSGFLMVGAVSLAMWTAAGLWILLA